MNTLLQLATSPGLVAFRRGLASIAFTVLLGGSTAIADPLFASSSIALTASPAETGQALGTVAVAARMKRLETLDGFHRVALEGWARAGADRVLFALPGKRILVAQISKNHLQALEQTGETVDPDTGIAWNRMRIEGWIPQAATAPELDPLWTAAWDLFAKRCTVCHQRRVPEHYTANQWRSLVKVMGPRTGLPKADQMLILAFLQHHASDTIDQGSDVGDGLDTNTGR